MEPLQYRTLCAKCSGTPTLGICISGSTQYCSNEQNLVGYWFLSVTETESEPPSFIARDSSVRVDTLELMSVYSLINGGIMARPKSEEKRNTLLSVAAQVFAKNGLTASTASITNAAGMAEGTLFIYFKGKDELMNTLYVEIKNDLAETMLAGHPHKASPQEGMQHIWNNYIDWGIKNPDRLAVMHKLKVWEGLKPEIPETTAARFAELNTLIETAIASGALKDVPYEFMIAIFSAQAETVMQFIKQEPGKATFFKERGFEMFWTGITSNEKVNK